MYKRQVAKLVENVAKSVVEEKSETASNIPIAPSKRKGLSLKYLELKNEALASTNPADKPKYVKMLKELSIKELGTLPKRMNLREDRQCNPDSIHYYGRGCEDVNDFTWGSMARSYFGADRDIFDEQNLLTPIEGRKNLLGKFDSEIEDEEDVEIVAVKS